MERIWIIIACTLAVAAATLLWFRRFDAAFVCGAVGILAWFIDMRNNLRKVVPVMENNSESETDSFKVKDEN